MEHTPFNRRDFLRLATFASMAGLSTGFMPHRLLASTANLGLDWSKTLVMIKFDGGNDGLNTVIPYSDPLYYSARPNTAIPSTNQIPINRTLAFNSVLEPLTGGKGTAWGDNDMVVALGVGYPEIEGMDSHFHSSDIWGAGISAFDLPTSGWITRFLDEVGTINRPTSAPADAAMIGGGPAEAVGGTTIRTVYNPGTPPTTRKEGTIAAEALRNPTFSWMVEEQTLVDTMAASIPNVSNLPLKNTFPSTAIGNNLKSAAQLIIGGAKIPILSIYHGSFDTHTNQMSTQTTLLTEFADALAVFRKEMIAQGHWNNVLVMTHSEFGRSMYENSTQGCDHGKANCHFILGGNVKGGRFIGNQLPLSSVALDSLGIRALEYQLDFRNIYASIMLDWWKAPRSASNAVLQASFDPVSFLKT